ncbi:MAG: hypothetical protein DRJ42_07235 [Deltaproteobacteria bacterium]|nr:MAG: hypothetical protein DRJ42_07235 [Deltaproteobacteria bacterium]
MPLDGVSDEWTVWGADPLDSGTSSAAIMVLGQTGVEVSGRGCDDARYGFHEIRDAERHLAMDLDITAGDEAEVEWQVDWFDCGSDSYRSDLHRQSARMSGRRSTIKPRRVRSLTPTIASSGIPYSRGLVPPGPVHDDGLCP